MAAILLKILKCHSTYSYFYHQRSQKGSVILFDHKFWQFNPTKFYKYKQFNLLEIPSLRAFGSAPAFYFIKTCTSSFITVAGEIRNKYRPVTDFVRVVSVFAYVVDTPFRQTLFLRWLPPFTSYYQQRKNFPFYTLLGSGCVLISYSMLSLIIAWLG